MAEKKYLPQSFRLGAVETLEIWTILFSCALGQMLRVMELELDPMMTGTLSDCVSLRNAVCASAAFRRSSSKITSTLVPPMPPAPLMTSSASSVPFFMLWP